MNMVPSEFWPWIALAGLGLFHGLNPAMGWLFAVALGLHRNSQRVVLMSLVPIALGHAAAIAAVLFAVVALGRVFDYAILMRGAAFVLIGWAVWHALYGHRHRVRVGMQTGLLGLVLWSFLMASGHGAGLMLIPLIEPICASVTAPASAGTEVGLALAAIAVHGTAMLAAIGAIAVLVYNWIGVDFLRRGWVNLDLIWIGALIACGLVLLAA